MRILRGVVPALVVVTLVTAACGGDPEVTAPPSATPSPTPTPTPGDHRDPVRGGRVPGLGLGVRRGGLRRPAGPRRGGERPDRAVRAVRARCRVPGPARAPVAGVLDATSFASLARDPDVRPTLAGTGPYVVDRWVPGENVLLARAGRRRRRTPSTPSWSWPGTRTPPPGPRPSRTRRSTASTRRAPRSSTRSRPSPSSSSRTVRASRPRSSAFGAGPAFSGAEVRRAFAGSLDRGALVTAAFPAGTTGPVAPDAVHRRWRLWRARLVRVQRPGRRRRARDRGVRPRADLPAPRPRRPGARPAGSGRRRGGREGAARGEPRPEGHGGRHARRRRSARPWTTARSTASISTASSRRSPMPSGFLEPLFGEGVRSTPARRATGRRRPPSSARPPTPTPATGPRRIGEANTRDPAMPPSSCRSPIPARPSRSAATSRAS